MDYLAAVRAFAKSADFGSFSGAARDLGIKTSTVSRYITELETDLGIALFNRSTRGLVLTEGGRVFFAQIQIALTEFDNARSMAAAFNKAPQGLLRVTVPPSFARRHIVPHIGEFLAAYPEIDVDLLAAEEALNLISTEMDLAIRTGSLPDSGLMARRVALHRRVACASPAYLARCGTPATIDSLAEHAVVQQPRTSENRWFAARSGAHRADAEVRIPPLRGRLRCNDYEAVLELALRGFGIAFLPTWLIAPEIDAGRMVRILSDWEIRGGRAPEAVWAIYPPKRVVSTKVRAFMDHFGRVFDAAGLGAGS